MNRMILCAGVLLTASAANAADDLVFADFEGGDYGNWHNEGDAFGGAPATGAFAGQKPLTGFAGGGLVSSMRGGDGATGRLTSPDFKIERRYITFHGRQLFVDFEAPRGELRVEVLDERGQAIAPYSAENSCILQGNSTRQRVTWQGADDLAPLIGQKARFRFHLRQGQLYAFWVSPDVRGACLGYVAGGGPQFDGPTDTVGSSAR